MQRALSFTTLRAPSDDLWMRSACRLVLVLTLTVFVAACTGIPRVNVAADGDLITNENGEGVEIAISLSRRPNGVITVVAFSANEAEGTASDAVLFDQDNWQEPQIIRITGVDDAADDGDVAFAVTLYATNSRLPQQPPLRVAVLEFVNRDDEVARFQALGDLPGGAYASYVRDVSSAGDVVVGWSLGASGDQAVRWTPTGGLEGLSGAQGQALAVSPNGRLIAGSVAQPLNPMGRGATLWQPDGSYEVLRAPQQPRPPGGLDPTLFLIAGNVVLDDGRVFASCYQSSRRIGCRYDAPLTVTPLNTEPFVADASNNYAGRSEIGRNDVISYNGGGLLFASDACRLSPGLRCTGEARDFSQGGAVLVGTSRIPAAGVEPYPVTPLFDTAWFYAGDTQRLPDLPGGEEASGAYAVSADGRLIAGFATDERGRQAVVWIEGAVTPLADLVLEQDGALPPGWALNEVRALSSDGRTLVGDGTNSEGNPEGFRVVLATVP